MNESYWSPQQAAAIREVKRWLDDYSQPPVFRLFGFAGTGKTTLAKHLADNVSGKVCYASFTGKAALNMQKKGCLGATTIHSLIYKATQDPVTGKYSFKLNRESEAARASLIVIDEVSMVGEKLARDLLSFGTKLLVLGDPAQLPPVGDSGFLINAEPDVMLTEVHRQAADSPIIWMSMAIREGRGLQPGRYGDCQVAYKGDLNQDELEFEQMNADQILCGRNKTRQRLNERIRTLKDIRGEVETWHPNTGDRLVCLKNNHEKGLLNGSLWEVESAESEDDVIYADLRSLDEPGRTLKARIREEFFTGTEDELHWTVRKDYDEFTFAQALTCHKAQGSQWSNVLVYDEGKFFREHADRWSYTAVTRAADRVTVIL